VAIAERTAFIEAWTSFISPPIYNTIPKRTADAKSADPDLMRSFFWKSFIGADLPL
jgi:hypothetical protein